MSYVSFHYNCLYVSWSVAHAPSHMLIIMRTNHLTFSIFSDLESDPIMQVQILFILKHPDRKTDEAALGRKCKIV